jgi:hypothetical protein
MTHWLREYDITPHNPEKPRHEGVTTQPAAELYRAGEKILTTLARYVVPRVLQELAADPDQHSTDYEVTYQPFGDKVQGRGFEVRIGEYEGHRVRLGIWPDDPEKNLRLYRGRRGDWMPEHGYGDGSGHGHGYAISSLPVIGSQKDQVLFAHAAEQADPQAEVDGELFRVYQLDIHGVPGEKDRLVTYGEVIRMEKLRDREIPAGQIYTMPPTDKFVHAVTNGPQDSALTVSLNGVRMANERTLVYFHGDASPIEDERLTPPPEIIGNVALRMIQQLEQI